MMCRRSRGAETENNTFQVGIGGTNICFQSSHSQHLTCILCARLFCFTVDVLHILSHLVLLIYILMSE